jgi:hypothetical protein
MNRPSIAVCRGGASAKIGHGALAAAAPRDSRMVLVDFPGDCSYYVRITCGLRQKADEPRRSIFDIVYQTTPNWQQAPVRLFAQ